jgi:hypothetical protein
MLRSLLLVCVIGLSSAHAFNDDAAKWSISQITS